MTREVPGAGTGRLGSPEVWRPSHAHCVLPAVNGALGYIWLALWLAVGRDIPHRWVRMMHHHEQADSACMLMMPPEQVLMQPPNLITRGSDVRHGEVLKS